MQILVEELARPMAIQWERGMTDDEYFQFCANNPDVRIERSAEGDILIMSQWEVKVASETVS